jgi:DNA repair exonuclease SbcCD ATPase subunit
MKLSSDIKKEVRDLESRIAKVSESLQQTTNRLQSAEKFMAQFQNTLGWRERYLWGWLAKMLGGNENDIEGYRVRSDSINLHRSEVKDLKRRKETLDKQTNQTVRNFLAEKPDDVYVSLMTTFNAATDMKQAVSHLMGQINSAKAAISGARSTEGWDMLSKSKTVSFVSTMSTHNASGRVKEVRRSLSTFQEKLNNYNETIRNLDNVSLKQELDDGFDLVFDMIYDGFDFMSAFNLAALGEAANEMRDLSEEVGKVNAIITEHYAQTSKAVDSYVQKARSLCV